MARQAGVRQPLTKKLIGLKITFYAIIISYHDLLEKNTYQKDNTILLDTNSSQKNLHLDKYYKPMMCV